MWSIALKTLVADRGKLLTALVGVVFSIVLVNVQGGLFLGFVTKAGLLIDNGRADIWVGHRKMHNVDFPRDIPRRWTSRIRGIPGVKNAEPYLIGWTDMTLPSGGFESVVVVGVEPVSLMGNVWNVTQGRSDAILQTDGIIVDECELEKLEYPVLGDQRELGGRRARIVGMSHGVMGFLVAPYAFTTFDRAAVYLKKDPGACSYILVELEPGADVEAVRQSVAQRVPDADVYHRDTYSQISTDFWMTRTGLGISFGAATMLGLLVGMVMVAETLYALVLDRLGEFGTLKAIGATERQVFSILIIQALTMATLGSVLGLACVAGIQYVFSEPRAPIVVPWWLSLGSCVLVSVICLISALLPYLRIRKIDPMMVLQS
jgi:putative ABC transport system permease protein